MPVPYGTFTKETWDFNQPDDKKLLYFVSQMVEDASNAASLTILQNSYVCPFYLYPSEQELKAGNIDTTCIITVAHDQDTQALYPDAAYTTSKTLEHWVRPYVINATIKNINTNNGQINSDLIQDIKTELIDLLCFNNGTYSNTSPGSITETYENRPLHNELLESLVTYETTNNRISHYYISLTILFTIYKQDN